MGDASQHVAGTGGAPLAATRRYDFTRVVTADGEAKLTVPFQQRGSWDDFGVVQFPEQEVFVDRLLASLGITANGGHPGERVLPDVAALDRVWTALVAALRPPVAASPVGHAQRGVSAAESNAVSASLMARFLDLVSTVAGLAGEPFVCLHDTIDHGEYETTRSALWRRGEVTAGADATAIESGYGIHGERCTYALKVTLTDGRDVSAYAAIDARSGGEVSVTVRGVLDAQALADGFVTGG